MVQAHPFAHYVRILGRGKKGSRSLTFEESREAMAMIVAGQVDPLQLGAFLMLLRVKEESHEELAGFVTAVRESLDVPAGLPAVDLDWPSYAGKRQHHPWYLLAALALTDQGYRILMHGSSGHSDGRLYTEQALTALGIPVCLDWDQVSHQLASSNFAYIPMARFCPAMEYILQLKPVLGLRSVANSLARLVNPLAAPACLSSIFHPRYGEAQLQTMQLLEQANAGIFKGEGGEIERKPDAVCELLSITNGTAGRDVWPRLLPGRAAKAGTPDVVDLVKLWRDDAADEYGRQAVLGTLAIALKVLGQAQAAPEAMRSAEKAWESRNRSRL